MPLVTVIIPTHNYGRFIGAAVASLQRQTWQAWECVIVDDGSTDATAEVVAGLVAADRRVRYLTQEHRGMSAARNLGLEAATGRYLQFLDADDALQTRKLEAHVAYLEAQPDCAVAYGPWGYWDGGDSLEGTPRQDPVFPDGAGRSALEPLLMRNTIAVNAPLVRAAFARRIGPFASSLNAVEDWEYWLRFALHGHRFARLEGPNTMALVRIHSESVSQDRVRMFQGGLRLRTRIHGQLSTDWQRRLNLRRMADDEVWLGTWSAVHGDVSGGVRLVLRAGMRSRLARHFLRAAFLPVAASPLGKAIGSRCWPHMFGPGRRPPNGGQTGTRTPGLP